MKLPWHSVAPVAAPSFRAIRREAIFTCCKWDPQVEDICVLSPQPIVLTPEAWAELVSLSERLAAELIGAERELLQQPACWRELGLTWSLRRRMGSASGGKEFSRHFHFVRFDFHFTPEGWRISEANSDVPGGFNEASGFSRLIQAQYDGVALPGDPAAALAAEIRAVAGAGGTVALVYATAFTDDRQVMVFLAKHLEGLGLKPVLISPDHLRWEKGRPFLATDWSDDPVDFVFRFFPAEWLPALPRRCGWWHLLGGAHVPLCNAGSALLTQSKRFPLQWGKLTTDLPTWRALLPPTYDPRELNGALALGRHVLKSAFGRVGDMIRLPGVTSAKESRLIERAARRYPREWIAQEPFEAVPLNVPDGEVYPCVGVYTLNGRVVGAYGRIARQPLINHLAQDAAVLLARDPAPVTLRPPITNHDN